MPTTYEIDVKYGFIDAITGADVPFDKDMRIASDTEWLKRAITPDMVWLDSDKVINIYNAENPDSLTNQFARGEIKVRFSDDR